jgi:DNA-binding transcriptional regulator YiaG
MKSKESKQPSVKEIEFDADLLLQSLRGHADHLECKRKLTLRVTNLTLPEPVKDIKPREIAGIRQKLNVSQPVFAALLNVPLATARSWEQGKRKPSGAALRLLDLARQKPTILLAA